MEIKIYKKISLSFTRFKNYWPWCKRATAIKMFAFSSSKQKNKKGTKMTRKWLSFLPFKENQPRQDAMTTNVTFSSSRSASRNFFLKQVIDWITLIYWSRKITRQGRIIKREKSLRAITVSFLINAACDVTPLQRHGQTHVSWSLKMNAVNLR